MSDPHHTQQDPRLAAPGGPPGPLVAACILWIVFGALLTLGVAGLAVNPSFATSTGPVAYLLVGAVAITVLVLGIAMLRGAGNAVRITLTVIGGLFCLALWPVVFAIPAVVLQFQRRSNAYFTALASIDHRGVEHDAEEWDDWDEQRSG
ncbi:MAG: hypothetical protein GEV10_05330 [Streptosporangiales bacterium]|nr:hypothetical protein [Streptosporangiales bacterium]